MRGPPSSPWQTYSVGISAILVLRFVGSVQASSLAGPCTKEWAYLEATLTPKSRDGSDSLPRSWTSLRPAALPCGRRTAMTASYATAWYPAIGRVLAQATGPIRVRDIHAAVKLVLESPVRTSSVNSCLT